MLKKNGKREIGHESDQSLGGWSSVAWDFWAVGGGLEPGYGGAGFGC
jgi:hypothetical protein